MSSPSDQTIREAVRETYGGIARHALTIGDAGEPREATPSSCWGPSLDASRCGPRRGGSCCEPSIGVASDQVLDSAPDCECDAGRFYSATEIGDLPKSVTGFALGCGNPTAIAELQPGEVVLDLGAGGGIDCFLAAKQVGPEGRVIGLDMTPNMVKLARRNAKKVGATNVDFRFGEIEEIPLPDASVDAVISNCVINLSPDKDAVFREAYRVLRPGGRMSVSDIVIKGEIPASLREQLDLWASCVAGALEETEYLARIRGAGFGQIEVVSRDAVVSSECGSDDVSSAGNDAGDAPSWEVISIRVKALRSART